MSRPKRARLVFHFDPETLAEAMRYLQLKRKNDAVLAALLQSARDADRATGLPVFIDRRDPDWRDSARAALASGCTVAMVRRGRLRRYRPGTVPGERLRIDLQEQLRQVEPMELEVFGRKELDRRDMERLVAIVSDETVLAEVAAAYDAHKDDPGAVVTTADIRAMLGEEYRQATLGKPPKG